MAIPTLEVTNPVGLPSSNLLYVGRSFVPSLFLKYQAKNKRNYHRHYANYAFNSVNQDVEWQVPVHCNSVSVAAVKNWQ